MKSKLIVLGIVVVLFVLALWLSNRTNDEPVRRMPPSKPVSRTQPPDASRGFRRMVSRIEYSVHARCRMKCRHITQEEVRDMMKNGKINYSKSDLNDKPCPTYALEGLTLADKQHVRIVFAQCDEKTKVVTCIDLDKDYACACR